MMNGMTENCRPICFCFNPKWLYNNIKMVVAVSVPTIDQRKRIPQKAIDQVVEQIVENFKPHRIILFGSYARGDPRPESDVDMLVIMDTPLKEVQQAIQICQQIEYRFGLDLIVHTPKHLAERLKMGDWFLHDVLKEGKVLYESRGR
jgi:uncharacterized protein